MSSDTIEGILYRVQTDPAFCTQFRDDRANAVSAYRLTDAERADVVAWDVRAIAERGVSQMLIMLANNTMHGPQGIPDYLRRLNTPAAEPAAVAG